MAGDAGRALVSDLRGALADWRVRRFWGLGLLAVFLHGVLDPLVTYLVVTVREAGTEANPFLAGHLDSGLGGLILVHVPLYVLAFGVLLAFTWLFARASSAEVDRLYRGSLVIWGLIILWGLILVGNNLWVLIISKP